MQEKKEKRGGIRPNAGNKSLVTNPKKVQIIMSEETRLLHFVYKKKIGDNKIVVKNIDELLNDFFINSLLL